MNVNRVQVQDDTYEHVVAMGFEVLQSFEEITNAPEMVRCYGLSLLLI